MLSNSSKHKNMVPSDMKNYANDSQQQSKRAT